MRYYESVPNFSEGLDLKKIDQIAGAAASAGALVLDRYQGHSTNRSVITIVGSAEQIADATLRMGAIAAELIDMRQHKGTHPRMGAMDVCPFVPLGESTMTACVELAETVGARMWNELGIPVYLYGHAARLPERQLLAAVRRDGYEGLKARQADVALAPDFGNLDGPLTAGACAVGARPFLLAFNVNLKSNSVEIAKKIAARLRSTAKPIIGEAYRSLACCAAIGWFVTEYNCAQVSFNLSSFEKTGFEQAYLACRELAAEYGEDVTGSELVGLTPLAALLKASKVLVSQMSPIPPSERELVQQTADKLGLNSVRSFKLSEHVLEYRMKELVRPSSII